jgi:uncharacterized protein YutE (UPF0331/DUF86 family)
MVIEDKRLERAESYAEAIDVLGASGLLPHDFTHEFARIASFRNFLAHDYKKIDCIVICEEALSKLDDMATYLEHIETLYT